MACTAWNDLQCSSGLISGSMNRSVSFSHGLADSLLQGADMDLAFDDEFMQPFEPIIAYRPSVAQSLQEDRRYLSSNPSRGGDGGFRGFKDSPGQPNGIGRGTFWKSERCLVSPQLQRPTADFTYPEQQQQQGTTWAALAQQRPGSQASRQRQFQLACTAKASPPCTRRTTWRGLKSASSTERPSTLRIRQSEQLLNFSNSLSSSSSQQQQQQRSRQQGRGQPILSIREAVSCSNLPDLAFLRVDLPTESSAAYAAASSVSGDSRLFSTGRRRATCLRRRRSNGVGLADNAEEVSTATGAVGTPRRRRQGQELRSRCASCEDQNRDKQQQQPGIGHRLATADIQVIPQTVGLYGDDRDSPPLEFSGSPVAAAPLSSALPSCLPVPESPSRLPVPESPSRLPVPESPSRRVARLWSAAAASAERLVLLAANGRQPAQAASAEAIGALCQSLHSLLSDGLSMSGAWLAEPVVGLGRRDRPLAAAIHRRRSRMMASPLWLLIEETASCCGPINQKLLSIVRQLTASNGKLAAADQPKFDAFAVACLNAGILSAWLKRLCSSDALLKRHYRPSAALRSVAKAAAGCLATVNRCLDQLTGTAQRTWPAAAICAPRKKSRNSKLRSASASRLPRPKSSASLPAAERL